MAKQPSLRKTQSSTDTWPGIMHRYVQYDPPVRCRGPQKFKVSDESPKKWVHTAYQDGKLIKREVLGITGVELDIAAACDSSYVVRGSQMPDTVSLFEVFERV